MRGFLGFSCWLALAAGVLLLGGLVLLRKEDDEAKPQEVELLAAADAPEPKKDEKKEQAVVPPDDELETRDEPPPDAAELLKDLELSALAAVPELEAASLGAITDALNGLGAGDFGETLSFASGGQIGGTGKPGQLDAASAAAFGLAEIDQKPRVLFQAAPLYPSELRSKKVEGVVSLIFVVDAAGSVTNPRVEKSSHRAFERPALDALRQWKFEPALKGGQRVSCKMRVPIRFQPS